MVPILGPLLLSVGACGGKEPGEDAVATVNGYEITASELNNELIARGADDLQDPATRRGALEAIINRKLLVALAQERELDQTPDFILAEQRSRELLLADAAARQLGSFNQMLDERKVSEFVRSIGSERFFYQVEGLRAPALTDPRLIRAIEQAVTFDEVRQALKAAEVEVQPADVAWDSAGLPAELVRQLNALPDDKPFVISQDNGIFAGVIRRKQRQVLSPEQARQLAEAAVGQESAMRTLNEWLGAARSSAEINYREGYGP
ncbi:hypothetical protein [Hoeflea sp.]|uniref:hypothetical protein n=1 Tax=Hoeflea sp. TaxID=1940281 RepID=UPI00198E18BF|nr:hypothetical protein [Hoeflea sp.]MBC7285130.1 hypothetical protein [Hoeflea sp.]